jgi:hypothetical protein
VTRVRRTVEAIVRRSSFLTSVRDALRDNNQIRRALALRRDVRDQAFSIRCEDNKHWTVELTKADATNRVKPPNISRGSPCRTGPEVGDHSIGEGTTTWSDHLYADIADGIGEGAIASNRSNAVTVRSGPGLHCHHQGKNGEDCLHVSVFNAERHGCAARNPRRGRCVRSWRAAGGG